VYASSVSPAPLQAPPPHATPSPSPVAMAQIVNHQPQMMILPAANPAAKDSRWLTLEVCREYQRSKCSRSDHECKFAHPPAHVEVQNGRVVACFDSIKGKCQRKDPPCKYLHPPQHLREQLLQNGKNNLILKNLQTQAYQQAMITGVLPVAHPSSSQAPPQAVLRPPTMPPSVAVSSPYDASPYQTIPTLSAVQGQAHSGYNPYMLTSQSIPTNPETTTVMSQALPQMIPAPAKAVRPDKFETSSQNGETVTSHAPMMDALSFPTYIPQPSSGPALPHAAMVLAKKRPRDPADDLMLQSTIPGMIPAYKRINMGDISKGGFPVYQTNPMLSHAMPHASLMQLPQPQYSYPIPFTGHPPSVQRF